MTSSVIKLVSGTETRTIIDLPDEQAKSLKSLASQMNLSQAELVRRAIADYLARNGANDADDAAFGIWRARDEDGLDYQTRLRSEWEQ